MHLKSLLAHRTLRRLVVDPLLSLHIAKALVTSVIALLELVIAGWLRSAQDSDPISHPGAQGKRPIAIIFGQLAAAEKLAGCFASRH